MKILEVKNHVPIYTWMGMESQDEWQTAEHSKKIAVLPWVFHHVALMADGHQGIGATVGSVIAMKDAVSPAAVGSDIFCGMAAVKYNLTANDLPDSLKELRRLLEKAIPVGFNWHNTPLSLVKKQKDLWDSFDTLDAGVQSLKKKASLQCGTLGGGNHYLELCLDTENNVWLILHSGSRNIGKEIADKYISIAKKLNHNRDLEDLNLAVFLADSPEFKDYYRHVSWCGEYASLNRKAMLYLADLVIQDYFRSRNPQQVMDPILCHHNYISFEHHFGEDVYITRKGAISAREGELGIIPGSMGTKSYIVKGRGNPDSFTSASHGAGRRMSRGAAKKAFTVEDLQQQTAGVECRKDAGVLDELPGAYKNIEEVMANQSSLVEVVAELKQVLCIKG